MQLPRFRRQQDRVTVGVIVFALLAAGALYLALVVSQ